MRINDIEKLINPDSDQFIWKQTIQLKQVELMRR